MDASLIGLIDLGNSWDSGPPDGENGMFTLPVGRHDTDTTREDNAPGEIGSSFFSFGNTHGQSADLPPSGLAIDDAEAEFRAPPADAFSGHLPAPDAAGIIFDDFFAANGAWRPPEPCNHCRRMRFQCFMLQTTEVNPNPVKSCSSCVALFRQCSLAERAKRRPLGYETSQPVIGQLHGVNEEGDANPTAGLASVPFGPVPGTEHRTKKSSSRSVKRTRALRSWFARHLDHPYPTEEEKASLAQESGMSRTQVINWFTNARRRRRQSERAVSKQCVFPQGSPLPQSSMSPMERWRHSPPEEEPASASSIESAIDQILSDTALSGVRGDDTASGMGVFHDNASSSASGSSWNHSHSYSAYASSDSAPSRSAYHSDDSNAGVGLFGPAGPHEESQAPQPARPRTADREGSKAPAFHCSFCYRRFKKKSDALRHERSVHMPGLDSWVCSMPLASGQSPMIWRVGQDDPECIFCGHASPTEDHLQSHEFESCAERSAQERTFSRKDHLWQHLYKFHGCRRWDGWVPDLSILQMCQDPSPNQ